MYKRQHDVDFLVVRVVAPVKLGENCKFEDLFLLNQGEIGSSSHVSQQVLGRSNVQLRRPRLSTSDLASAVHDVFACDLSEVQYRARNGLVPLRLFLVQNSVLRL